MTSQNPLFKKSYYTKPGTLLWSYLFGRDTEGKFADDKFKVTLRLSGDEASSLKAEFESLAKAVQEEYGTKEEVFFPMKPARDAEKKEIPGTYDFTFKTKQPPAVVDSKRNRMTKENVPGYKDGMILGQGAVGFKAYPLEIAGRKGNDYYVGVYLNAVMVTDLAGGTQDLSGFGDYDDGFVAQDEVQAVSDAGDLDDLPSFAAN